MILYPQRQKEEKLSVSVRGIGNALKSIVNPIPYRIVCESADWTQYFGTTFDNWQKFGQWDTNDCWEYSPTKQIEMQLNALWVRGEFGTEAKNFFINNNICTPDGIFAISDQFYDALSGNYGNGGSAEEYAQLLQNYGIIPQATLMCTDEIANQYPSQQAFDNYYYNIANVTPAMLTLGAQSLQYLNIRYQRIGTLFQTPDKTTLTAAMQQAPLAYGVPVSPIWNQGNPDPNIPAYVSSNLQHEVTGYEMTQTTVGYPIVDNYAPFLKVLGDGYSINSVIQVVITAIPVPSPTPSPTPSIAPFLVDMSFGQTSTEIARLQSVLTKLGYFPQFQPPTGFYGTLTCQAVLAFQKQYVANQSWWAYVVVMGGFGKYCFTMTRTALNLLLTS